MFKFISNYILHSYKSESYIIRKKSEYFLVVISLIIFSLLILIFMDLFITINYIYQFGDAIFLLVCSFVLLCLKNNKLEKAINIYIVGYIFIIFTEEIIGNLISHIYLSQYNVLDLVLNLVVGFIIISLVSIKRYQMNIIVLAGCVICILQFKMNYEAIRILDNQNCQLSIFAYCDNLTGLLNRKKLIETINILLFSEKKRFAVLFIDLDDYKNINDNFGHQNGDNILIIISGRLKSIIGTNETLYRIGGDEFIIILKDLKSGEIAEKFAQKINEVLNSAITYNKKKLYIGASIGISLFPEHGSDSDTLLNYADLAMFKVKNNGGNGYKIYSSEMKNISIDKLSMQIKLHEALKNNEFISYYQPILDLKSMKVIGAETLIRWKQGDKIIFPIEELEARIKIVTNNR